MHVQKKVGETDSTIVFEDPAEALQMVEMLKDLARERAAAAETEKTAEQQAKPT